MNIQKYQSKDLEQFLIRQKISTLKEIKTVLGTDVDMTAFRKLKQLSYRSSYSHGGRYYTLDKVAKFDDNGLWCHLSVCFSQHGNLLSTLEHLIAGSEAGFFAKELEALLAVSVKESLLRLIKKGKIDRKKVSGVYLYCAADASMRRQQLLARRVKLSDTEDFSDEVKAAIILFVSILDEQQRRLFAGFTTVHILQHLDLMRKILQVSFIPLVKCLQVIRYWSVMK
ncbi:hypothetical protein [Desulfosarcina ovata]|uniref:Uncharacterized protein n=1 Tax=Desulfosarcina ovata subsp. ovata TaxID=2752305 RepID=A0A5K8A7J6_9BACT|nr:hypothetical protein [Desulfosarcina ovata]BBO88497.1 hypothetical protein DSCOOX_16770 [Desulfosarcina ovata subsp. ovata]